VSASIALAFGFPIAYWIARKPEPLRSFLLAAVSLPLWVPFLIRVYAWMIMLGSHGPISNALVGLGFASEPPSLLHTRFAACLGIAYSYLPFLVFPIYASLSRADPFLAEAAADLGATPSATFRRVTLPLARPGIIAGALLIAVPALGEFVIPELLGSADTLTLGRVLWSEFFDNRDWALASALAITLLLLTFGIVFLTSVFRRSYGRA
jgi:putrescine transport system permease protein